MRKFRPQVDFIEEIEMAERAHLASSESDKWLRAYYLASAHAPRSSEWYAYCRSLYDMGAGLFMVAHRRWADNMQPAEVMGYMWEALLLAVLGYKPETGVPFRAYWLSKARSVLQHHYRTIGQGLVRVSVLDHKAGVRAAVSHHEDADMEAIINASR